ncbi:MAG: PH domain-containing protein [Promethearchaeota archaeon]
MSLQNYLNNKESILYGWDLDSKGEIKEEKGEKLKVSRLGVTNKRVFHYKKLKGYDREYRDIPLEKISYIETAWHNRNLLLLILSVIFFATIALFIVGIILLVKGLKQYGYLIINGDDWKFHFKHKEDVSKIEEFIREVYFIKSQV